MKTETGYTYVIDDKMVVNPEEKPDHIKYINKYCPRKKYIPPIYGWDLKAWKPNCIPVVNAERAGYPKRWFIFTDELYEITDGQKVQHVEGKVIKLL